MLVIMLISCGEDNVSHETDSHVPVATENSTQSATMLPAEDSTSVSATSTSEPTPEPTTVTVAILPTEVVENELAVTEDVSDPLLVILNAYKQLGDAKSLRVISNTCSDLTVTASSTFEFIQPNLYRRIITYKDGNSEVEEVGIGDKLYLKRDETWEILPLSAIMFSSDPAWVFTVGGEDNIEVWINDIMMSSLNVRATGEESLDGHNTQVYQYETNNPVALWTTWIGETDGRLYRVVKSWEVDSDDESYTCAPITAYEYDIPLEIEPPISNQ